MLFDINIRHLDVASSITANTPNIGSRCRTPRKITGASYFHKKQPIYIHVR